MGLAYRDNIANDLLKQDAVGHDVITYFATNWIYKDKGYIQNEAEKKLNETEYRRHRKKNEAVIKISNFVTLTRSVLK